MYHSIFPWDNPQRYFNPLSKQILSVHCSEFSLVHNKSWMIIQLISSQLGKDLAELGKRSFSLFEAIVKFYCVGNTNRKLEVP